MQFVASTFNLFLRHFILLISIFGSALAFAQSGIPILLLTKNAPQPVVLTQKLATFADKNGKLTAADVLHKKNADKWILQTTDAPQFGYSDAYNWVRLCIKTTDTTTTDWVWALDIPATQRVDMYQITNGKTVKSIESGTDFPFAKRWLPHRLFLFPVAIAPSDSTILLVRVHNDVGSLTFFSQLYTDTNWHTTDTANTAVWVFFYTLFFVVLLVAIALWFILKETVYGYYTAYIACIVLFIGNNSGFSYAYLWSNTPAMVFYVKLYSVLGLVITMLNFQYQLLYDIVHRIAIIRIALRVFTISLSIFVLLVSINIPIWAMQRIIPIGNFINICSVVLIFALLIISIIKRYRPAYFFLFAVTPILTIGGLLILRNYQFIKADYLLSPFVMPAAFMIEILFLFFALLQRIFALRQAEQAKMQAEQALQNDRIRISRDLHDNVGAHLSQIITGLDMLEQKSNVNKATVAKLKLLSQTTIAQLRETIWTLHDDEVNLADFSDKLIAYTRQQTNLHTKIRLRIVRNAPEILENFNIAPLQALNLYRIAQEAINNALKYANADRLELHFEYEQAIFSIIIKDNGIGFDANDVTQTNNYGLQNMRARANEINAVFELQSTKNEGTTVTVRL